MCLASFSEQRLWEIQRAYKDFDKNHIVEYLQYPEDNYNQQLAAGVTAVMAADYYTYLNTGQLKGLLNGLKGAAEYENLMGKPDEATRGMNPQSAVHIIIILFIIIGNVGYFVVLRKKGAEK